jgi:PAS domain S-box-containing protein
MSVVERSPAVIRCIGTLDRNYASTNRQSAEPIVVDNRLVRPQEEKVFSVSLSNSTIDPRQDPLRTEGLLTLLLDNAPIIVYMKDLDGRFTYTSRHFETVFGVARDDFLGRTAFDVFSENEAQAHTFNDNLALAAPSAIQSEEIAQGPDGERVFMVTRFALRDGQNQAYALCGISTDITERRRREDASQTREDKSQARADASQAREDAAQTRADESRAREDASQTRADESQAREDASHTREDTSQTRADKSQAREDASHTREDASQTRADESRAREDVSTTREDASQTRADELRTREDASQVREDASQTRADESQAREDASQTRADESRTREDASQVREDASQTRADESQTRADESQVRANESEAREQEFEHTREAVRQIIDRSTPEALP